MKKNIRKRSKKTIILLISIISAVVVTATALVLSVLLTKKSTEIETKIILNAFNCNAKVSVDAQLYQGIKNSALPFLDSLEGEQFTSINTFKEDEKKQVELHHDIVQIKNTKTVLTEGEILNTSFIKYTLNFESNESGIFRVSVPNFKTEENVVTAVKFNLPENVFMRYDNTFDVIHANNVTFETVPEFSGIAVSKASIEIVVALNSADVALEKVIELPINIYGITESDLYLENDVYGVSKDITQTESTWTKIAANKDVKTSLANKISMSAIQTSKLKKDAYDDVPVFKDINIVNVDFKTGEKIGFLNNAEYAPYFEWYGKEVTLPAGFKLASGRVLSQEETFEVDVYTVYPEHYVKRWRIGNIEYIALSENYFAGSVYIEEYLRGTFEASRDRINGKYVLRSYALAKIHASEPLADFMELAENTSMKKMTIDAGKKVSWFGGDVLTFNDDGKIITVNGIEVSFEDYLYVNKYTKESIEFKSTLTYNVKGVLTQILTANSLSGKLSEYSVAWDAEQKCYVYKDAKQMSAGITDWHVFDYNCLYLVKYADWNSQDKVGLGQTTNPAQSDTGVIGYIKPEDGSVDIYSEYNSKGSHEFLIDHAKGKIRDGYVGLASRTSVWCLGLNNPWGNSWELISGIYATDEDTDKNGKPDYAQLYVCYDPEKYAAPGKTITKEIKSGLEGYTKLGFAMSSTNGWYRYFGMDDKNQLITVPELGSPRLGSKNKRQGVSADFYSSNQEEVCMFLYGGNFLLGGRDDKAGINCFHFGKPINMISADIACRILVY